jgi:hypothetical protein
MRLSICEIKDGEPLSQYEIIMPLTKMDGQRNRVEFETWDDNGFSELLQIPKEDFEEFVRQCQKMLATLSS